MQLKLLLGLLIFFVSCSSTDRTMWRFDNKLEKQLDSATVSKLRFDGYFKRKYNGTDYMHFSISPEFILLNDGRCVFLTGVKNCEDYLQLNKSSIFYEVSKQPRYLISGDSLIIQRFYNTNTPGGRAIDTVVEIQAKIINDSTLIIHHTLYNSASSYWGKGIQTDTFSPPEEYNFVKCGFINNIEAKK